MMRTETKSFLIVLFLLFFCWECAQHPALDLGLGPVRGPEDIVERINKNASYLHSLRAEARLFSPHIPQSRLAKATVLFAEQGRYRVTFSALFGMTAAVMTVRQKEVSIYMPLANRLYEGQFTPQEIDQVLGINMSLTDLMAAMVGAVRLPPVSHLRDYRKTDAGYTLSFLCDGGHKEVQVAEDGLRVLEVVYFDARNQTFLIKTFRDHRVMDGIVRPGEISLVFPTRAEELKVIFTRQEVNPLISDQQFWLDIPTSVERIRLPFE